MNHKTKIILSIFSIGAVLVLSGCGCKKESLHQYDLSLEIWGSLDNGDALREVFENYKRINPNIAHISYKKIATDTYKKELIDALASGQGPDIFLMNNAWLPSFQDKVVEAPVGAGVVNEQKFRNNFVDVAANDFIDQGKIYAVPLSVDSLGLYYNKDFFNEAGITGPPADWNSFIADVRRLTDIDSNGNIVRSGAAIGTAFNINRSTDLLTLIMLQNGTEMVNKNGRASFSNSSNLNNQTVFPGEDALNFYAQFASAASPNYTWNSEQHYSIDAFSEGKTAMMFNYSWHMSTIENKAPKLNFAVAPVPQFNNTSRLNYANYWGYAVAKNKVPVSNPYGNARNQGPISNDARVLEAWRFLTYLTTAPDGTFTAPTGGTKLGGAVSTNFDPARDYLEKTGEPAARRDIIEGQKSDPRIGVFAADNLIAKSWRQSDPESIESIFATMIDQVNRGQVTVADALKTAVSRVQNLSN